MNEYFISFYQNTKLSHTKTVLRGFFMNYG